MRLVEGALKPGLSAARLFELGLGGADDARDILLKVLRKLRDLGGDGDALRMILTITLRERGLLGDSLAQLRTRRSDGWIVIQEARRGDERALFYRGL